MSTRSPHPAIPASAGRGGPPADGLVEADAPALAIRMRAQAGHMVVELDGELDIASGAVVARQVARLMDEGGTCVVADLTRLTFCDAAGLGSLVKARNRLTREGGWLRLAAPTPQLRRILQIAGLTRTLPSYDTVCDALAAPAVVAKPSGAATCPSDPSGPIAAQRVTVG